MLDAGADVPCPECGADRPARLHAGRHRVNARWTIRAGSILIAQVGLVAVLRGAVTFFHWPRLAGPSELLIALSATCALVGAIVVFNGFLDLRRVPVDLRDTGRHVGITALACAACVGVPPLVLGITWIL